MQVYANSNRPSLKIIFFFFVVALIAFLPVSSFLFFLKNDAFVGYFPPKFFMSESIHAGYLPLWNPYINFGFPQYGDMSGGFWSPVTWLIASTVGYNAYTLTIELLCYIFLGGIGMYQLTGAWQMDKKVRIIAGLVYMCCGYNVGHLQHFNWLSGAAFLPWCFWGYLCLLNRFSLKYVLLTTLLFYMLAASAHPGIIISSFYFFAGVLVFYLLKKDNGLPLKKKIKQVFLSHAICTLFFLLLSAGMIAGYLDILPHFVRGEKISLSDSLLHPANIRTWISTLLPFVTVKNDAFYNTDPSMRNSYFSLVLLLFFLLACVNKKNSWQKFLFVTGLSFAFLSAGGIFKTFAYKFIPFIGYVRLNGEFRIFSLLCFIIIASIELDKFIRREKNFEKTIKWIYYLMEILVIACIAIGLYKAIAGRQSFMFASNTFLAQNGISLKLKAFIDAISFYDTLWIQGIIQLFILWGIKFSLRFRKWTLLKNILVADMIIASLLNIPFTGAGKASVAQVQSVLNKSPRGIPVPVLQPIKNIDTLSTEEKGLIGDWSMYNKQVGVKYEVPYPIVLKNMSAYFENSLRYPGSNFLNEPFIFVQGGDRKNLIIKSFSPNKISVAVTADSSTRIVMQQNFYPHWYYQNGAHKSPVDKAGINFMSAPVKKGNSGITFSFEPTVLKWAMLLSGILFVFYCLLLFIPATKKARM